MMQRCVSVLAIALLVAPSIARAADRTPVAVVWLSDQAANETVMRQLSDALSQSPSFRPIDSVDGKNALENGGPQSQAVVLITRGEAAFAKLKFAEAVTAFEAAETLLLTECSPEMALRYLARVERALLVGYDHAGDTAGARRAVARLQWAPGDVDDLKTTIEKYDRGQKWAPQLPPVIVSANVEGAQVYRDLQLVGKAPVDIAGGDPAIDVVMVEAAGMRRVGRPLSASFGGDYTIAVNLEKEDRLGVMVDDVRALAPDAPAAKLANIGRRVGAARLLILMPSPKDGPNILWARYLDVAKAAWAPVPAELDLQKADYAKSALNYLAAVPAPSVATQPFVAAQPVVVKKSKYGKWYTWVAAGGIVVLVGSLFIAQQFATDSIKITATK